MRVPVVLLTGWLGSGKTSLLNRLFREAAGRLGRFAILVNELGDVGIDASLLPASTSRQVELPGGCICCQLDRSLIDTLVGLLDREPGLETVLIETTGVADPLPITWSLEDEALAERVRVAAVVTVVDAVEHESSRPHSPSVDAQVRNADLLVVSKLDLADGDGLQALVGSLRERNPDAPVLTAPREEVADLVLEALLEPAEEGERERAGHDHDHDHDHDHGPGDDHGHGHGHGPGGHGFATVSLPLPEGETYDLEELAAGLEALPGEVVRIKGVARVIDGTRGDREPHQVAFHRVGTRFSYDELGAPAAPRVVAIGRVVDSDRLAACFASAVVGFREGRD